MSRQNHTIFEEGDTNMLLESYVITLLKKKKYYINKHGQISPCAKKHMARREKELVHGSFDPHADEGVPPGPGDLP
jgi:hypothetical protein